MREQRVSAVCRGGVGAHSHTRADWPGPHLAVESAGHVSARQQLSGSQEVRNAPGRGLFLASTQKTKDQTSVAVFIAKI